jgi:hypothetical protein
MLLNTTTNPFEGDALKLNLGVDGQGFGIWVMIMLRQISLTQGAVPGWVNLEILKQTVYVPILVYV